MCEHITLLPGIVRVQVGEQRLDGNDQLLVVTAAQPLHATGHDMQLVDEELLIELRAGHVGLRVLMELVHPRRYVVRYRLAPTNNFLLFRWVFVNSNLVKYCYQDLDGKIGFRYDRKILFVKFNFFFLFYTAQFINVAT